MASIFYPCFQIELLQVRRQHCVAGTKVTDFLVTGTAACPSPSAPLPHFLAAPLFSPCLALRNHDKILLSYLASGPCWVIVWWLSSPTLENLSRICAEGISGWLYQVFPPLFLCVPLKSPCFLCLSTLTSS